MVRMVRMVRMHPPPKDLTLHQATSMIGVQYTYYSTQLYFHCSISLAQALHSPDVLDAQANLLDCLWISDGSNVMLYGPELSSAQFPHA